MELSDILSSKKQFSNEKMKLKNQIRNFERSIRVRSVLFQNIWRN